MVSWIRVAQSFLRIMTYSRGDRIISICIVGMLLLIWPLLFFGVFGWEPWPMSLLGPRVPLGHSQAYEKEPIFHTSMTTVAIVFASWGLTQSFLWMNSFPVLYLIYCQCWSKDRDQCVHKYSDTAGILFLPVGTLAFLQIAIWLTIFPAAFVAYKMVVMNKKISVSDQKSLTEFCRHISYDRPTYRVSLAERCLKMNEEIRLYFRPKRNGRWIGD